MSLTSEQSKRKSWCVARPRASPFALGCVCGVSVPMATWTVTGVELRYVSHNKLDAAKARIGDAFEMMSERLAEALVARLQSRVKLAAGFLGCAKAAIGEHGFDIFAGVAGDGDFEIVNRGGAIQCESSRVTAAHEIDKNRREAALDDVAAESPDDHLLTSAGVGQCVDHGAQGIGRENVRERIEKAGNAAALCKAFQNVRCGLCRRAPGWARF